MTLAQALAALRKSGISVSRYTPQPWSPFQGPAPEWITDTWIITPPEGLPTRIRTRRLIELAARTVTLELRLIPQRPPVQLQPPPPGSPF